AAASRVDVVALGDEVLRVGDEIRPVRDDPPGAETPAGLLVRRSEKDDVPIERWTGALHGEKRHELGRGDALRVERATSVDVAVLARARERWQTPAARIGRDDVEMREQDDGLRRPVAGEPRIQVSAAWRRFENLRGDAFGLELPGEEVRRRGLRARRILGVDPDDVREEIGGLVADAMPVRVRAVQRAHAAERDRRDQERSTPRQSW